ncbi:MAG: DNA topoisomerase IV subunit A [Burkholderiales bacterium]
MADLFDNLQDDTALPLAAFAEKSYLEYAMSVVTGRALPDVADGQKPVQRRILYAMHELGLYAPARHVKSARVVGDVLGKYHPHGDTAAYDALVRQAQDFTLRYPLIDGQGNFGSRDGDNAAAMRYTECRLTPIAELLLSEIDQDTVDFAPNYDGAFREPKLLPARLPMLLANGASGIGVGMATDIPPHNLREIANAAIATIRNPQIGLDELLAQIPGPDLPGGGRIISSPEDIRAVYETGRGSLRVRAQWTVEELARGQWRIAVTELPFGVSARVVMEDVERATNPKPKEGKKSLSQDQLNLKALFADALDTMRDESDKSSPVRLVFEPRSSRQNPQEFVDLLLMHTRLEDSLPVNLVMLGRDGRPRSKNLKQAIEEWIAFRFETVTRRTKHRLGEVDRRIHILEGRQKALLSIDKVIRIIRNADDPKADLMAEFGLSEIQADDILEIRLRQLARLEGIKIDNELKALNTERKGLKRVLGDGKALSDLIVGEIERDADKYGDARRTKIEAATSPVLVRSVPDEPVTITVSRNGWIRSRQGHGLDATQFTYKAGDGPLAVIETRTIHPILILDTRGRAYTIRASDVPGGRGDGSPVTTMIELQSGAKIAQAISGEPEKRYLVAGSGGHGFVAKSDDMVSRVKAGKAFMTLEEDESPVAPVLVTPGLDHVAALTDKGKLLVFGLPEMREMERGRGVMLVRLDDDDRLAAVALVTGSRVALRGIVRGKPSVMTIEGEELARHKLHRARKGYLPARKIKAEGFA